MDGPMVFTAMLSTCPCMACSEPRWMGLTRRVDLGEGQCEHQIDVVRLCARLAVVLQHDRWCFAGSRDGRRAGGLSDL